MSIAVPIDVLLPAMLAGYAVGGATGALMISALNRPARSGRRRPAPAGGRHRAR